MRTKGNALLMVLLGLPAFLYAGIAMAQSCEAHFPFDGSLADASGNGFDGRMIGADGAPSTPRFVAGRSGQALALDGTAAMRAFVDLHYEACPQVSFTAWVRFDGPEDRANRVILATGGAGPGLRASGTTLVLNGTGNGLWAREAIRAEGGWMFVAGVYDYANSTYALHWRNRSLEGTLSEHRRPPEDAIWVGAMNDRLAHPASNIVIDELRIFESALGRDDLRALARGAPTEAVERSRSLAATALPGDQFGPAQLPGDQFGPAQLPGDQYAPTQAIPRPGLPPDSQRMPEQLEASRPIDFGADSDAAPRSREIVTADVRESLQERVEESRPPELGYDSEEEGVAATEAAAERRVTERREREDAEAEAAVVGSPAGVRAGTPRPIGPPRFTAIAGTSGDTQRTIDLVAVFLRDISWQEFGDVPCRIWIGIGDVKRTLDVGCPTGVFPVLADGRRSVTFQSSVISSIEVCQRNSNQRLKGIRVVGDRVNPDGSVVYVPGAADQESVTNCQTWSPRVLCPSQHVATGLVVHTQERRGDTEAITGLQLVCRAVLVGNN